MARHLGPGALAATPDAALMRSDDPAAFAEVVRRHGVQVSRVAASLAGEAADDVVQQALLAAWLARDRFDPARGALPSWLTAIARNRALDALRAERRHHVLRPLDGAEQLPCPAEGPDDVVTRRAHAREIRAALRRIPPAQCTALALAYYGGLSQAEIQAQTRVPLGTVKGRLRLGLGALRTELAGAA